MRLTWMSVIVVLLGSLLVGCAPQTTRIINELPAHELNLKAPQPRPASPAPVAAPPAPSESTGLQNQTSFSPKKHQRDWRYIVVHHSATEKGNARTFDKMHRDKGWDGLGYHFVICNGRGSTDGKIEVGPRWKMQKWGAHCGGTPNNEYNNFGIGICLVGDFSSRMPSSRQLASLKKLIMNLMITYDIPPENVIGHKDAPQANTACPGRQFHKYLGWTLRRELTRRIAAANLR